jgi:Flp pilus assembly protein TadD
MSNKRQGKPARAPLQPTGAATAAVPSAPSRKAPSTASSKPTSGAGTLWIALTLIALNAIVYAPVLHHDFVSFDDPIYVTQNPHISKGLTADGIAWAFTSGYAGNWHPITWLSHMLDVQLFGLNPGGHHLTNLLFHTANTVLLFVLLFRMTGILGPCAFVAALFAVHPAHVESVAWVAERKDVLSAFFLILTVGAYVEYVRRPHRNRYAAMLALYALGLMAKPMLVTLPVVLLLLDVWPLRRTTFPGSLRSGAKGIFREKAPLFALAAASSLVTFLVQRRSGFVQTIAGLPLASRIANALVSYAAYAVTLVWPSGLGVYYPFSLAIPAWKLAGACAALAGISILVYRHAGRHPYLAVGWLWYIVTLLPVIGIVQVGEQSMADRYTYIPSVGLFIIAAWAATDFPARGKFARTGLAAAGAAVVALFAVAARAQTRHWQNGVTLWTRTLAVTTNNYVGHSQMAYNMRQAGKPEEAIAQYNEALRINPDFALAHQGLGVTLSELGRYDEAIRHLTACLRFAMPGDADTKANAELALTQAHLKAAFALGATGKTAEAIGHLNEVVRINPDDAEAHNNLGFALTTAGPLDTAAAHFMEALRIKPELHNAHYGLAIVFQRQGRLDDAVREGREALRLKPDYAEAQRLLDAIRPNL